MENKNINIEEQLVNEIMAIEEKKTAKKEDKKMTKNVEKKEEKKVTKKASAKKNAEKKVVEKVEATENKEVKNVTLKIEEIVALYAENGIKVYNPQAKGNYRIMGFKGGSSLNVTKKEYKIYSTDDDFAALEGAKIEGVELAKGANAQDKARPNTVIIQTVDALKAALKVYAQNTKNQVAPVAVAG